MSESKADTPVVLIGFDRAGDLDVIGLYADFDAASAAVNDGSVPIGRFYSIATPAMGSALQRRNFDGLRTPAAAAQNTR